METASGARRFPALERPWVAWPLQVLAVLLALVLVLSWAGRIGLVPWVRFLAIVALIVSLSLGSRRFREGLANVQSMVLLALIYVLGIGVAALAAHLTRRDLLDLRRPKASLWHKRAPLSADELARSLRRQF